MACGSLDTAADDLAAAAAGGWSTKKTKNFALVVKRGQCALSHKALWAMAAGARAVIVGHSEPGQRPVRMRSVGNEIQLVNIPSIMVSAEDADELIALAEEHDWDNDASEDHQVQLSSSIGKEHVYRREFSLKQKIYEPRSKREQRERADTVGSTKITCNRSIMAMSDYSDCGTVWTVRSIRTDCIHGMATKLQFSYLSRLHSATNHRTTFFHWTNQAHATGGVLRTRKLDR